MSKKNVSQRVNREIFSWIQWMCTGYVCGLIFAKIKQEYWDK